MASPSSRGRRCLVLLGLWGGELGAREFLSCLGLAKEARGAAAAVERASLKLPPISCCCCLARSWEARKHD